MTSTLEYTDVVPATPQMSSPVQPGGPITVSWNDQNIGDQAVSGQYYDLVQVFNVNDPNDPYLVSQGQVAGDSTLAGGNATSPESIAFTLPAGAAGMGFCTSSSPTNYYGYPYYTSITQYDSNGNPVYTNTASTDVTSALEYTDVVPTTPQVSSPVQSGGQITVSWSDQNIGDQSVSGQYYDLVQVFNVNDPNNPYVIAQGQVAGDSTLAGGNATSPQSMALALPAGAAGMGNLHIVVTTNYYGYPNFASITQYDGNGNPVYTNSASTDVTSTLEYTDVLPVSLQVSTPVQSGGQVTISWNDENIGDQAVSGQYYDYVQVFNVNDPNNPYVIAQGQVAGDSTLGANSATSARALHSRCRSAPRGLATSTSLSRRTTTAIPLSRASRNTIATATRCPPTRPAAT